MFCFSFCPTDKEEVTKPSGFTTYMVDDIADQVVVVETKSDGVLFPHLEHLNQPIVPLDDDDTSISEESLFDPIVAIEPVVSTEPASTDTEQDDELVPFDEPSSSSCPPTTQETDSATTQPDTSLLVKKEEKEEESIQITKDEFIAVLQKIEKENEWYEKRQAKKAASSKKKSRRNNNNNSNKKNKKKDSRSTGTRECKKARNSASEATRQGADRPPLTSRN